ncbi:hypothetical protein [Providencia sp. PROV274]|uniref:hypothetical protein n=1 Tax=Providencia sp. PROV274 TaxID=2949961 RepID=UPI0023498CEE|nr:hypothetical protein [Providencia sp. PROV274]
MSAKITFTKKLMNFSDQALNEIYREIFNCSGDDKNFNHLLKPEYFFNVFFSKFLTDDLKKINQFVRFELTYKEILNLLISYDKERIFSKNKNIKLAYLLLNEKKISKENKEKIKEKRKDKKKLIEGYFASFQGRKSGSVDITILENTRSDESKGLPRKLIELKTDSNNLQAIKKDIQRVADFMVWYIDSENGNLNSFQETALVIVGNNNHHEKIKSCYQEVTDSYNFNCITPIIIQNTIVMKDPTFDPAPDENPERIVYKIGCTVISFVRCPDGDKLAAENQSPPE